MSLRELESCYTCTMPPAEQPCMSSESMWAASKWCISRGKTARQKCNPAWMISTKREGDEGSQPMWSSPVQANSSRGGGGVGVPKVALLCHAIKLTPICTLVCYVYTFYGPLRERIDDCSRCCGGLCDHNVLVPLWSSRTLNKQRSLLVLVN